MNNVQTAHSSTPKLTVLEAFLKQQEVHVRPKQSFDIMIFLHSVFVNISTFSVKRWEKRNAFVTRSMDQAGKLA